MDLPTLQADIDSPTPETRALLFAHLADRKAAVRAKAAEGLLQLYATRRFRGGLARDFGTEPEAVLMPMLDELRDLIDEPRTESWTRFVNSLVLNLDSWRDGTGYDIDALLSVSAIERGALEQLFTARLDNRNRKPDWRDLDAARALDLVDSIAQLSDDPDPEVRLRSKLLSGSDADVAAELAQTLLNSRDTVAVSKALDYISDHATEAVKAALIHRVQQVDANFINAALVLLEVFANSPDPWAERPFLFEAQEQGRDGTLMKALIARVTG